jgi:AcrR family transcriptional regulator
VSVVILGGQTLRVNAATKLATRTRILEGARALFSERGFAGVTTRDIARAAGIASGTLFNYFPTKEAIAAGLAAAAAAEAHARFGKRRRRGGSLEEDLFALIATEIRSFKPHRNYISAAIAIALADPDATADPDGGAVRAGHWAMLVRILADHGIAGPPSFMTMHLYWTLYAGVLTFWSSDNSPNQEDSLAVLDHSLKAFVATLPAVKTAGS